MGVECLRLLNEIIADFDEVSSPNGAVISALIQYLYFLTGYFVSAPAVVYNNIQYVFDISV